MEMKSNNAEYNLLIQKLDQFIRKYYKNKMIRGGHLWLGLDSRDLFTCDVYISEGSAFS